jgi:2-methylcitrate dehydratase PrpD
LYLPGAAPQVRNRTDRPVAETFERGRVAVTLTDGSVLHASATIPRGHPQAPLTDAELEGKFRDCATRALAPGQADGVWEALAHFELLGRVAELTALMCA